MADPGAAEFRALREAIAARGQLRSTLALTGLLAWSGLLALVLVALSYPVAAALPLTVLVATFEVIRPLHAGAERIGRYLQVFFEEAAAAEPGGAALSPPAWERTAMALGATVPGAAGHPLFAPVFGIATAVNFLAVLMPGPVPVELAAMAVPHAAFLAWLLYTDRGMRAQRVRELARFRELRGKATTK